MNIRIFCDFTPFHCGVPAFIRFLFLDVQGHSAQGEKCCTDCLTLMAEALVSFEASGSVYPTTQYNTSEGRIVGISDARTSRLATLRTVLVWTCKAWLSY
jgi:hypothetical protein